MSGERSVASPLWAKAALSVGFLLVAAGMLTAYSNPASAYEISPYTSISTVFWDCMMIAAFVSLGITLHHGLSPRLRAVGVALGGGTFVGVLGLPVIRNYQFFGPTDSLTHLGWVRDFQTGALGPFDILYPATHVLTLVFSEIGGMRLGRAGELMVVVYFVVYFLFLPLCVAYLSDHDWAVPFGIYAAFLLLPINNASVFRMMHPTAQAILFLPLVLFVVFRYLYAPDEMEWLPLSGTSWGALVLLTATSLMFVHPQQAVNLIVILSSIAAVQMLYRRYGDRLGDYDFDAERPAYVPALYVAALFGLWIPQHDRATGPTRTIVEETLVFLLESGDSPVDGAAQRGASLQDLGGSIEELFVKLFFVTLVFFVAAGGLMLLSYAGRVKWKRLRQRSVVKHLSVAFVPLVVVFLLYFLSSVTTQHYRQLGLLAMVGSLLGAVALSDLTEALAERFSSRSVLAVAGPILVVLLLLSATSIYRSPYIYQSSDHIPEMELTGYETVLDHRSGEVTFTGIRGGTLRHADYIYGKNGTDTRQISTGDPSVPTVVFNKGNLTSYYDEPHYVVVSQRDYERETRVFNGFRFAERGFDRLDRRAGVSKIVANPGFRVYYVDPGDAPAANATAGDAAAANASRANGAGNATGSITVAESDVDRGTGERSHPPSPTAGRVTVR
jgi:hypothetical protein